MIKRSYNREVILSAKPDKEFTPSAHELETFTRQLALSNRIALEALHAAGIPEGRTIDLPIGTRWRTHYRIEGDTIVLSIEFRSLTTTALLHFGFTQTVHEMLRDLELLLSDPDAMQLFGIENDDDVERVIYGRLVGISFTYLNHLPMVIYQGFCQAAEESIISDIRKSVEPMLRDGELESEVDNLRLMPNKRVDNIVKRFPKVNFQFLKYLDATNREFNVCRKAVMSDRRAGLTPKVFESLCGIYEELRVTYTAIKNDYKEFKTFYSCNHNDLQGWEDCWQEYLESEFSGYKFSAFDYERPRLNSRIGT